MNHRILLTVRCMLTDEHRQFIHDYEEFVDNDGFLPYPGSCSVACLERVQTIAGEYAVSVEYRYILKVQQTNNDDIDAVEKKLLKYNWLR